MSLCCMTSSAPLLPASPATVVGADVPSAVPAAADPAVQAIPCARPGSLLGRIVSALAEQYQRCTRAAIARPR